MKAAFLTGGRPFSFSAFFRSAINVLLQDLMQMTEANFRVLRKMHGNLIAHHGETFLNIR
jgi:hypothetical protein